MKFLDRFKRKPKPEEPEKKPVTGPSAGAAIGPSRDKKPASQQPAPAKTAPAPDELRLELGDFLHRIPAQLLQPGPHDLKTELRFDIQSLSQQIAKGHTTIALAEIYRRVPNIFRGEILESDNVDIRFPWQKLAKLVASVKPAGGQPATDVPRDDLAERLRARKPQKPGAKPAGEAPPAPAPAGPILPGRGGSRQATWFSRTAPDRPGLRPPPLMGATQAAAPEQSAPETAPAAETATDAAPAPAPAAAAPAAPEAPATPVDPAVV
ncbi:MAG: hypothetical protein ABMA01_22815, partial [Chthoniobacteraceae bacterium]